MPRPSSDRGVRRAGRLEARSIGQETVDQACASRTLQAILAAAARAVRGVPGTHVSGVFEAGTVIVAHNGRFSLDALYGGIEKFADWITDNRSTFFVSSYTPHTAPHNAYLERLLRERSVPYSSELRSSHLQGMVTFLPAGDISHRDFVSHAWADYPIKDILVRMDDADQGIETAGTMPSPAGAIASRRN